MDGQDLLLIAFIIFIGAFVQGAVGFGSSLIAVPFLIGVIGVKAVAPLMVLVKLVLTTSLAFHYRHFLSWKVVGQLFAGAMVGAPVGVLGLAFLPETIVLTVLGLTLTVYALYALFNPNFPEPRHAGWAYLAGFGTGLLASAYGIFGPPVAVYGACKNWSPQEFKGTLQAFFAGTAFVAVLWHTHDGNFTLPVTVASLVAIPATVFGAFLGASLDPLFRRDRKIFRIILWIFILSVGLHLLASPLQRGITG